MSSPAYGNASVASPFAADSTFGSDNTSNQGYSQRLMSVKVIYTLNDKNQSPCLHRLPQPQPVMVVVLEDGHQLGMIDLRVCVEEVLKASPELLPKLKEYDHAVYAYDYSEEDVPTVGHGKLSTILGQDGMGEESAQIVGRIIKNPMAVFKKQSAETLEVKLKFVALPSDSPLKKKPQRPQLLETSSGTSSFTARMQAAYDRPSVSSPQIPMTSSPAYMPDDLHAYHQDSPSSMTPQELDLFLNSPIASPPTAGTGPPSDPITQSNQMPRPASRMAVSESGPNASSGMGEHFDDGPAKKRARLEQAPRPRNSTFGAQPSDAPLRRTASTAASIRNFRPILPGATQTALGQETDGANRAPTPRPQRTRNVGLRRASTMSTMSTLRQESSIEDVNVLSSSPSRSPDNPSPTFTSSPPLRDFEVYDETQTDESAFLSSPLPPYEPLEGSGFNLDEFEMTFSELPDLAGSEFDAHVDIQLGSGLPHDSGIGMMSEEPDPMMPAKGIDAARPPAESVSAEQERAAQTNKKNTKGAQTAKPARKPSVARPNQKTQSNFAPGEHPLYQQRTTKIAWNSYSPQGGPALYVQTPRTGISSQNKARNSLKLPQIPGNRPTVSGPLSAPLSTGAHTGSQADPQQQPTACHESHGRASAGTPTSSVPRPTEAQASYFALPPQPASQQQLANPSLAAGSDAPSPYAAGAPVSAGGSSPPSRERAPLGDISGNAMSQGASRASTPRPTTAGTGEEAQTPGSKAGAKRKRTASKAPTKTTKETPSGRTEKRPKRGPRPLIDEDGNRIHCYTCGAIESATWRSLYLKIVAGPESPAQHFEGIEKVAVHPNVDPAGNVMLDTQGRVKEWMVFRKSVGAQEQQSGDWTIFKQCNACGVHFNQHGSLKVPDWAKLMDAGRGQQQGDEGHPIFRPAPKPSEHQQSANIDLTACDDNNGGATEQEPHDPLFDEPEAAAQQQEKTTGEHSKPKEVGGEEDKENMPPDNHVPSSVFDDFAGQESCMLQDHTDFEYLWGRGFDELVWSGEADMQATHDHAALESSVVS